MKKVYKCEKCNAIFDNQSDCFDHELICGIDIVGKEVFTLECKNRKITINFKDTSKLFITNVAANLELIFENSNLLQKKDEDECNDGDE